MNKSPADLFDALAHEYDTMRQEVGWDPFPHVEVAFPGDLSGQKLLDVGCGTGEVLDWAVQQGARGVGLDVSSEMCSLAAERLPGVPFLQHDLNEPLELPDHSFSGVIALGCLEYVQDIPTALAELARVLQPGGTALYVVELCGPGMPGGPDKVVPFLDDWQRVRVTLQEARNTAEWLFADFELEQVPGYVLEDSAERVQYARIIGAVG